ncbi:MAG TPA: hypothetical protein P5526_22575 [Anaerolineae bacterium]|nr:hypothetical protein [Anaerolineae bacterium]
MTKTLPRVTADRCPLTAQAPSSAYFLSGLLSAVCGPVAKKWLR